jgi:serine/threonine-protein kinase
MDPATQPIAATSASGLPAAPDGGPDLSGKILGDFQVLRRLGHGGMGHVYLAEQISLKRKVALKLLRPELAADVVALQRFKAEAEAVARATHANIVQVYAIGEAGGLYYMALEYVEGRTLREHVEKKGPPEILVALSVIRQVAAALQRAGELGIVHRDIKPENILLTRQGEVKVADFGLSRIQVGDQPTLHLTTTGVAMGTPLYMSPEQVEGKAVDPRTDIYSFGITCYHMLVGQPPYQGQNPFEVALQHVQGQARPLSEIRPDLPPALCAIVHKMMARQPEHRYQAASEIVRDIAQLRDTVVGIAPVDALPLWPTGTVQIAVAAPGQVMGPLPARNRRWLHAVGAAAVLLALAGGAWWGWQSRPDPAESLTRQQPSPEGQKDSVFPNRRQRESLLAAELAHYAHPGNNRQRIMTGLRYAIELALIHLEDGRLDRATELFADLDTPGKVPAYQTLGQTGQAIVLALQDQPVPSNQLFEKVALNGLRPNAPQNWFQVSLRLNPAWRRLVAQALDRNFDNRPAGFPAGLETLRRPPGARAVR